MLSNLVINVESTLTTSLPIHIAIPHVHKIYNIWEIVYNAPSKYTLMYVKYMNTLKINLSLEIKPKFVTSI
jgi:hypothetical protein